MSQPHRVRSDSGLAERESRRQAASVLQRAVRRAADAWTLQEGLHTAYLLDFPCLLDSEVLPPTLRQQIDALADDLGSSLGFERGGYKVGPSTLSREAAAELLSRLEAATAAAERLAGA